MEQGKVVRKIKNYCSSLRKKKTNEEFINGLAQLSSSFNEGLNLKNNKKLWLSNLGWRNVELRVIEKLMIQVRY